MTEEQYKNAIKYRDVLAGKIFDIQLDGTPKKDTNHDMFSSYVANLKSEIKAIDERIEEYERTNGN